MVHTTALVRILNPLLRVERNDGELDFLTGHVAQIDIEDVQITFRLTFERDRLRPAPNDTPSDFRIAGQARDFLRLATRREDPDTLFFSRRLRLEGDTELGLYTKNLLDSVDLESRLGPLHPLVQRLTAGLSRCTPA